MWHPFFMLLFSFQRLVDGEDSLCGHAAFQACGVVGGNRQCIGTWNQLDDGLGCCAGIQRATASHGAR